MKRNNIGGEKSEWVRSYSLFQICLFELDLLCSAFHPFHSIAYTHSHLAIFTVCLVKDFRLFSFSLSLILSLSLPDLCLAGSRMSFVVSNDFHFRFEIKFFCNAHFIYFFSIISHSKSIFVDFFLAYTHSIALVFGLHCIALHHITECHVNLFSMCVCVYLSIYASAIPDPYWKWSTTKATYLQLQMPLHHIPFYFLLSLPPFSFYFHIHSSIISESFHHSNRLHLYQCSTNKWFDSVCVYVCVCLSLNVYIIRNLFECDEILCDRQIEWQRCEWVSKREEMNQYTCVNRLLFVY